MSLNNFINKSILLNCHHTNLDDLEDQQLNYLNYKRSQIHFISHLASAHKHDSLIKTLIKWLFDSNNLVSILEHLVGAGYLVSPVNLSEIVYKIKWTEPK
uniref:Hypotheticial protein n=1 Tax=Schistosoma japonicum TaxID=6182 RepID=C1LFI6_SCHJA|nr:hypotheticial protein [Schistosoma japonicum]